jgi:L-Ala-D/L-Glu epimerase
MMSLQMKTYKQTWELDPPFIIAGEVWSSVDSLIVELADDFGHTGRSETQGVSYRGETYSSLAAEVEALRGEASAGMSRETLQALLPAGGARNALDVALWDLQAQQTGQSVNKLLGLGRLRTVQTVFTLGIMSGDEAATIAGRASAFGQLKLKVDGGRHIEMIAAVREARPDARIIVDANQSWSFQLMKELMPELDRLHVDVLEQPLPVGGDDELEGFISPILLMADESCQDTGDLPTVRQRYGGVNIKLDKAGGLTEAMTMSSEARSLGLKTMVGNMCGGSLAMAPAFLVAQSTDYVDLDGPLLQTSDWENGFCYQGERMFPSDRPLWGKLNSAV